MSQTNPAPPTRAEDIAEVMTEATIGQDTFDRLFRLGRSSGYRAARTGPFPVVRMGRLNRYPTPPLRKALCLEPEPPAAA